MSETMVHDIIGDAVISEASVIAASLLEKMESVSKGDTLVIKTDRISSMDSSFVQIVVAAMQEADVRGITLRLDGKKACALCAVVECEFGGTTCIDGLIPEKELP